MNDLPPAAGTLVRAPAKLNFGFEVLGKRGDDFHEIVSFMVPIDLSDDVLFVPTTDAKIECHAAWAPGLIAGKVASAETIPPSDQNLATRALVLLRQRSNVSAGGVLYLRKRTPLAAGLGGGSSDAAAALWAANRAWGLNWSADQLAEIAAELGSDIPFFVHRRPAVCRGRGERIEPVSGTGTVYAVVVKPPVGLNTAQIYGRCESRDYAESATAADGRIQAAIDLLRRGDWRGMSETLVNGLRRAACQVTEWIDDWCDAFSSWNTVASQMTGSGSCCFGVCRSRRHARRLASALGACGRGQVIFVRCGASPDAPRAMVQGGLR